MEGERFDVQDVYRKYKGEPTQKEKTILEVFDMHNERFGKLVGIEYSKFTHKKFEENRRHLQQFIQHQYGKQDMLLKDLTMKFLKDLDFYFKTEMKHKQSTTNKKIQRVRKIVTLAVGEGFLDKDPFMLYKPKKVHIKLVYLDTNVRWCRRV